MEKFEHTAKTHKRTQKLFFTKLKSQVDAAKKERVPPKNKLLKKSLQNQKMQVDPPHWSTLRQVTILNEREMKIWKLQTSALFPFHLVRGRQDAVTASKLGCENVLTAAAAATADEHSHITPRVEQSE